MEIGVREILESIAGVVMTLLSLVWRNLNGEIKASKVIAEAAVPRKEFVELMDRQEASRKEFRESLVKLFERTEAHERRDNEAFQTVTRDFTQGMNSLRDSMFQNTREILKEMNGKADK